MFSPNSIHGGGVSTPGCGASSRLTWALDAVLAFKNKLIVTDLQMVLAATLFAAFALFAALFFPPAALHVAARDRGSAQPGLSQVVLPPLLPGFPSDGNTHCRGCCHGCFQSPGLMLGATRRDFLLWALVQAAMIFAVFEGCVFETLSEVVFELVLPCFAGILALSEQDSSCQSGSDPVSDPGAATELPGHGMDLASREIVENDVPDGAFVVGSSGSCIDVLVPFGCSSSSGFLGRDAKRKAEDVKLVQFFVNRGKGFTTVVRCSSGTVLSKVLHLDVDEYALCGSRFVKVGCTIGENFIGNCSNVQVLRRLRGGAGAYLDIPGQWECKVCGATRCWPARKRCYKCDAPRDTVPKNLPMGPMGRAPPQSSGPRLVIFHTGMLVLEVCSLRVQELAPALVEMRPKKKVEASELLQALSLLQRIMTPEDFVKYQVLVAPKPKPGKTREQELADRVKSLHRLRTQEATYRGQIDKLELDLQRHRDMLQGVLSRKRVESEECDELRAQVAKEQAPSDTGETIPPTQSD